MAMPMFGAEVIATNLTTASAGTQTVTTTSRLAASFRATAAANLTSITIPVMATDGARATLYVYADGGSKPGLAIGSMISPDTYSTSVSQATFTGNLPLSANSTYWVVLQPLSGTFSWSWTNSTSGDGSGFSSAWAFSFDSGVNWYAPGVSALQMAVTVNGTPAGGGGGNCTYTLNPTTAAAPAAGGFASVTVTTNDGCAWTAVSNAAWITISTGASGTGTGMVLYSTQVNLSGGRIGSMTIAGQTFNVTQGTSDPTVTAVFRAASGAMRSNLLGSTTVTDGGGVFGSDPASAQDANGNTYVAARDTYGSLWVNVLAADQTWGTWTFLGGSLQGKPAIQIAQNGTAYIAIRDSWNAYWMTSYTPSGGAGAWTYLAGIFTTDPALAASADGSLYVVGKDFYSGIWGGRYTPSSGFAGWQFGGGIVAGAPSVAVGTDGVAYVAARDLWGSLWVARMNSSVWLGWSNGGGQLARDPQIASMGNGQMVAAGTDLGGSVYRITYTQGTSDGWGSWVNTGGVLSNFGLGALSGEAFIFGANGTDGLWWNRSSTGAWIEVGITGLGSGQPAVAPR